MISDENEIVGMPHVFGLCGPQHNVAGTIFFNALGKELHSVFFPPSSSRLATNSCFEEAQICCKVRYGGKAEAGPGRH